MKAQNAAKRGFANSPQRVYTNGDGWMDVETLLSGETDKGISMGYKQCWT